MTQEDILCRFCLDTTNEKSNPLVEPCGCRGSLRYVHAACLSRWRRMNPERNANICLLCFTLYNMSPEDTFEIIPDFKTIPVFFLRFPFFLCVSVHYGGILYYSMAPYHVRFITIYQNMQYVYQILYIFLFYMNFHVRNKRMYWRYTLQAPTFFFISGLVVSNLYLKEMEYLSFVPITLCFGLIYMRHIHILYTMIDR